MDDFNARKWLDELRRDVVDAEREQVKAVAEHGGEVYFHDIVHEVVDPAVARLDRFECLAVIDEAGGEEHVDRGLLNFDSIDTLLATMAYGCAEMDLFEDDFVQELQGALNNEKLTPTQAKEILARIEAQSPAP